jgi:hypothetical protein
VTRDPVFDYLLPVLEHARSVGEVPLISSPEWAALPSTDHRKSGAVARAAMTWHREGLDPVLRERLERELAEENWLCAWRLRRLSGDLSEAEDWSAIASWTAIATLKQLRTYEPEVA